MNRRGRQTADLSTPEFAIMGRGSNHHGGPPHLPGRGFFDGRDDLSLPAELFDYTPGNLYRSDHNGDLADAGLANYQPGRTPTPQWEYGFLGMDNSRNRVLDPLPNSDLAQHRIYTKPFRDEVTGPWVLQYQVNQEVYRQFNTGDETGWGDEG